jgi:hypothetical protein
MSVPGEAPTAVPSGVPWREPGWLWRAAFWAFVLIGLFCGSAVWGWAALLAAILGLGTIGVLIGTVVWGPLGWRGVPRIASSGVSTGLGTSAAAGLLAASPGPGALVVLALIATHPAVAFGVRLLLDPQGKSGTSKAATPEPTLHAVPDGSPDLSSATLNKVDDATLCDVWCQSYLSLCTAESRDDAAVIAADRQGYLDEMFRRNPTGMAAWFAAGARPGASPMTFLTRHVADG